MNSNFLNYWKKNLDLIFWKKKPKKILEKKKHYFKWFEDGKVNVYQNCVKNHLNKFPEKEALIIYDKNKNKKTFTFEKLDTLIENFSYHLFKYKLSNKDIVAIHASASIESAVAMLSCAKLGITFSVIFEDLPISSVIKRINLLNAKILITRSNSNFLKKGFSNSYKSSARERNTWETLPKLLQQTGKNLRPLDEHHQGLWLVLLSSLRSMMVSCRVSSSLSFPSRNSNPMFVVSSWCMCRRIAFVCISCSACSIRRSLL